MHAKPAALKESPPHFLSEAIPHLLIQDALKLDKKNAQQFISAMLAQTDNWESLWQEASETILYAQSQPLYLVSHYGIELPIDPRQYPHADENKKFLVEPPPESAASGCTLHLQITYGYNVNDEERRIGSIEAIEIDDATGDVRRVWAKTEESLKEFKNHLFTISVDEAMLDRLAKLNIHLITELREHPSFAEKMREFSEKREFNPAWVDDACLAYFNAESKFGFRLDSWAYRHGYSKEEMYLAGWFEKSVSKEGAISYSPSYSDVIVIPFRDENEDIIRWRLRVVNPKAGDPKYRDSPPRREVNLQIPKKRLVQGELYNPAPTKKAANRLVFMTEGEFKGMVTYGCTDVINRCITGITLVYARTIVEIAKQNPNEIVICLDRDPLFMALERLDGITDSQRANYLIARKLIRAGITNVRIGELPDIFEGGKVGVDDFLLHQPGKEKSNFNRLLSQALTPAEYAKKYNLDETLQDIIERRTALTRLSEKIKIAEIRNGLNGLDAAICEQIHAQAELIEYMHELHTFHEYGAARSVTAAHADLFSLPSAKEVHGRANKAIVDRTGRAIPLSLCTNPIALLTIQPSGLDERTRTHNFNQASRLRGKSTGTIEKRGHHAHQEIHKGFLPAPYFWRPLREACRTKNLDKLGNREKELFWTGLEKIYPELAQSGRTAETLKKLSYHQLTNSFLAGYVLRIAPPDTYNFYADVQFLIRRDGWWQNAVEIPILVTSKKSGVVKGMFVMPEWHKDQEIAVAMGQVAKIRSAARSFLREPEYKDQREIYKVMANALWNDFGQRKIDDTYASLSHLGIKKQVISERKMFLVRGHEWKRIEHILTSHQILLAAYQGDLFTLRDGRMAPRFEGDVVLAPHYDVRGDVRGFLAIPLSYEALSALPPVPGCASFIMSGSNIALAFDPYGRFFGDNNLLKLPGMDSQSRRRVMLANNPIDLLILESQTISTLNNLGDFFSSTIEVENNACKDCCYLALPGSLRVRDRAVRNMMDHLPNEIIIMHNRRAPSLYDIFTSYDNIPGNLRDLVDLKVRIERAKSGTSPLSIKVIGMTETLAEQQAKRQNLPFSLYDSTLKDADAIETYLKRQGVHIENHQRFVAPLMKHLVLLDTCFESGSGELPGFDNIEAFIRQTEKMYVRLTGIYERDGSPLPVLDEFLQLRYKLDRPTSLEDLLRKGLESPLPIIVYQPDKQMAYKKWPHEEYFRRVLGFQP